MLTTKTRTNCTVEIWDMRIHQEIMLGIGGVQMLKALSSDGIPHE